MICKIHGELSKENIKRGIYRMKRYRKCRLCELERTRKYYEKKYADPNWVKEKHEKDKDYYANNKAEITAKRQSEEAKEIRRNWYKNNLERYREDCNKKQKAYRANLHDTYIRKIISNGDENLKMKDIPLSLVQFKRDLMLFKKGIRKTQVSSKINGDKQNENEKC